MNTQNISRIIIIFVTLTACGVGMIVFGGIASEESIRGVLPLIGSGMFSAALTFFLVEMLNYQQR